MLSDIVKLILLKNEQATSTSAVESDNVDTTGWDGCLLFTKSVTSATDIYATVKQNDGTTDVNLVSATFSNANDIYAFDIYRPEQSNGKNLSLDITRGTTTVTTPIYALLYKGRKMAVSQDDNTQLKQVIAATVQT